MVETATTARHRMDLDRRAGMVATAATRCQEEEVMADGAVTAAVILKGQAALVVRGAILGVLSEGGEAAAAMVETA